MTNPMPHAEIIHHISNRIEDLDPDQVRAVIDAWNAIKAGDPIGMVRRDEETGAIAHRVQENGTHLWRISHPDGATYNDLEPTLSWQPIYEPGG